MIIKNDRNEFFEIKIEKVNEEFPDNYNVTLNAKSSFITLTKKTFALKSTLSKLLFVLTRLSKNKKGSFSVESFSYNDDFSLDVRFEESGQTVIHSYIKSSEDIGNECDICFLTDSSYLEKALEELKKELTVM